MSQLKGVINKPTFDLDYWEIGDKIKYTYTLGEEEIITRGVIVEDWSTNDRCLYCNVTSKVFDFPYNVFIEIEDVIDKNNVLINLTKEGEESNNDN